MKIPQIDCRISPRVMSRVMETADGYRLFLSGNFFDQCIGSYSREQHRVVNARVVSPGIMRAFETEGDMLRLLAVHMGKQRRWFEQALKENGPTGHDHGFVHVCHPATDNTGEEVREVWVFYHTYQFDLWNLLHAIKQREEEKLQRAPVMI